MASRCLRALLWLTLASCAEPRVMGVRAPGAGGTNGSSTSGGAASGAAGGAGAADAGFTLPSADANADYVSVPVDATCGFQKTRLERLAPELLLVLDRSTSMQVGVMNTNNSRWTEATGALIDVLGQTDGTISWGLMRFPNPDGCQVAVGADVPMGPARPVSDFIRTDTPNTGEAGTPTATAVKSAAAYLRTLTSRSAKYIVLATDGEPSCPDVFSAGMLAEEEVTAARNAGFSTFVIGIATEGTEADLVLTAMANAGGRPRAATPAYYPVDNRASLVAALRQIAGVVASCTFQLDTTPPSPDHVAVDVDGMRVMRDPTQMNGWDYGPGDRSITLYGAACDLVKSGQAMSVDFTFGCPNVTIP